jgi:LAGLIDADG endonuclease
VTKPDPQRLNVKNCNQLIEKHKKNMNPNYISGLIQADGSFFVAREKRSSKSSSIRLRPKLSLTLHLNSIQALQGVNEYFNNVGKIYTSHKKQAAELVISSPAALVTHIIPHFNKYPLYVGKQSAFMNWSRIVIGLQAGEHYDETKNKDLLSLSLSLNKDLDKRTYPSSGTVTDQFIIGLVDGDGCFNINFLAEGELSFGFHITGGLEQRELFNLVKSKLGCGSVKQKATGTLRYQVSSFQDMCSKVIPFMSQYEFHTYKSTHFSIFKDVAKLVMEGQHRHLNGLLHIIDKAYDMNLKGKRRRLTKQDYINKYLVDKK